MPQPKGCNGKNARGHRDDTALDLQDIEDGLRQAFHWHQAQERAHRQQRRHVQHLHALTISALRSLAEAQGIDDARAAA